MRAASAAPPLPPLVVIGGQAQYLVVLGEHVAPRCNGRARTVPAPAKGADHAVAAVDAVVAVVSALRLLRGRMAAAQHSRSGLCRPVKGLSPPPPPPPSRLPPLATPSPSRHSFLPARRPPPPPRDLRQFPPLAVTVGGGAADGVVSVSGGCARLLRCTSRPRGMCASGVRNYPVRSAPRRDPCPCTLYIH